MYKIREIYSKNRHKEIMNRYSKIEQLVRLRHKLNIELSKLKDGISKKRFEEKLILMDRFYTESLKNAQRDIKKLKK